MNSKRHLFPDIPTQGELDAMAEREAMQARCDRIHVRITWVAALATVALFWCGFFALLGWLL